MSEMISSEEIAALLAVENAKEPYYVKRNTELIDRKVIEDIKAEMKSRIGTYYQIGERTDKNGTTIVDLAPYDKGTIEQMIRIIDEYIKRGDDDV